MSKAFRCSMCGRTVEKNRPEEKLDMVPCSEIFPSADCDGIFKRL